MRTHSLATTALLLSFGSSVANAANYDESVAGDLSNDRLSPTVIALSSGSNAIKANFGTPDLDYFTVTVPTGFKLSALRVGSGSVLGGIRSFIGVQSGTTMTVLPNAGSAAGLLGWTHFDFSNIGSDILADIGQGFGASGFTPPLPAGSYTFWVQETSTGTGLKYELELELAPVSERIPMLPLSGQLLLAGLLVALGSLFARLVKR